MRKVAIGLLILLIVLGGGWTAGWLYASREAEHQLDSWLKAEAIQGRIWTCPNRIVGGYPFAITVSCTTPSFAGRALDQTVKVSLAGLVAGTAIYDPRSVSISLREPLTYKTSDGKVDLKATWSSLAVDLNGLPNIDTLALAGRDLVVDGTFGETGRQGGRAAQLDANFAVDRQRSEPTLKFDVNVKGAPLPDLDAILGNQAPTDIAVNGGLDKIEASAGRTPAEAIERWRQAGGTVTLAMSRIGHGESSVTGSGALGLDEAHRPQGRFDASFVGLDQVLKRYGIGGNVAAAGNILSSLFGGSPRQPQEQPSDPNALNLPINVQNGRLGVGPIRTPIVVPPLY